MSFDAGSIVAKNGGAVSIKKEKLNIEQYIGKFIRKFKKISEEKEKSLNYEI